MKGGLSIRPIYSTVPFPTLHVVSSSSCSPSPWSLLLSLSLFLFPRNLLPFLLSLLALRSPTSPFSIVLLGLDAYGLFFFSSNSIHIFPSPFLSSASSLSLLVSLFLSTLLSPSLGP